MLLMLTRARNALSSLFALVLLIAPPAFAFDPPPFPRIGGIDIRICCAPFFNDTTYQAGLARQSVTVLGDYPNFSPGGETMFDVVQAIKAINPNTLIFPYSAEDSVPPSELDPNTGWPGGFGTTLTSKNWWLYPQVINGQPSGSAVRACTDPTCAYIVDNTQFTKDPNNPNTAPDLVTWFTQYYVNWLYTNETHSSTSGTFTPNLDGMYMDNFFAQAHASGDWDRNGDTDAAGGTTASSALRGGYTEYVGVVRSLMPGKYQIGNIGDWSWIYNPTTKGYSTGSTVPPEYKNLLNGGVMEAYIGSGISWAIENQQSGWAGMIDSYHKTMDALLEPKLGILNEWGVNSASTSITEADYQQMRYGLASTLMDDGYFAYTDLANPYGGIPSWFDEFSVDLGAAITPPQSAAYYSNGVYRRDFENGIALVAPKGNNSNSPVTVSLETSYIKVKGAQDPAINDGLTVTSVTLQPRDGIILLRPASTTNTFGRNTIGSTPGGGMSANYKRGTQFTTTQAGILTSLSAYLDGNGGAAGFQDVRMVLYTDNGNNVPDKKVVESSSSRITAGMPAQWINFTVPETAITANTKYWIVIQTGNTQGVARDYGDGSTFWYANQDNFYDGASDPFGAGSTGTTTLSVYASYVPGVLKQFGRTTAATSTSSGMSADYKRGTPFVMQDGGTLTSFSAYLDGNGGASGSQDVRMDLYQDAGGVPGALVAQSRVVTINSGTPAQWYNFIAPHTVVPPGTYWIVLHTGNVQGVARNYGDGSTSWYANTDPFWDGASAQFGTGITGTTTLSVYANYVH